MRAPGMVAACLPDMISIASQDPSVACALEVRGEPGTRRLLRENVRTAVASGRQRIVIDCAEWSELDLPLLSILVQCARECGSRGVELEIANLSLHIRASIEALRLDHQLGLRH
jgi:anti-anti-sigma regulatory factor